MQVLHISQCIERGGFSSEHAKHTFFIGIAPCKNIMYFLGFVFLGPAKSDKYNIKTKPQNPYSI